MGVIPAELQGIAASVQAGETPERTVRQLLGWFGAQRRGATIVRRIRRALGEAGLETEPDFAYEYIDAPVAFLSSKDTDDGGEPAEEEDGSGETGADRGTPYNAISRLPTAGQAPPRLDPQASIQRAVTLMLTEEREYVPVMTSDWEVKGVVSWKSVATRLALGQGCETVGDCMEDAQEVAHHASMFVAAERIARSGYVLVRGKERAVTGMVTAADLSVAFGTLGKPFLLIGEIELLVRDLVEPHVGDDDVRRAHHDEERESYEIGDLSFGELIRLLQHPESWEKVGLPVDKQTLLGRLEEVRVVRNAVMHFDPDGLTDEHLTLLEQTSRFLQRVAQLVGDG